MELEEARRIIEDLKGRFDTPFSSFDKETIEELYYEVTGRSFVPTSCQQCYHDALVEIVYFLKKNGKMAEKLNFRLKAGAIINCPSFMGGKVFSNENLTDEIAANYLKAFPEQIDVFEAVPEDFDPTRENGKKGKKVKGKEE